MIHTFNFPSVPGVGFNNDKFGNMLIRYNINDAIKLRDAFLQAARSLDVVIATSKLVVTVPATLQQLEKVEEVQLPPQVLTMPNAGNMNPSSVPVPTVVPAVPNNIADTIVNKATVVGGFEHDDGSLGEPPASIRH